jgi:hypothetical protein
VAGPGAATSVRARKAKIALTIAWAISMHLRTKRFGSRRAYPSRDPGSKFRLQARPRPAMMDRRRIVADRDSRCVADREAGT